MTKTVLLLLGLVLISCREAPDAGVRPAPSAIASSTPPFGQAPSDTSGAPSAAVEPSSPASASAAVAAGSPSRERDEGCMSAKLSVERAKPHKQAAAPFADCAAGVFSHCAEKGDNTRGHLCSRPLDTVRTARARKINADLCCY